MKDFCLKTVPKLEDGTSSLHEDEMPRIWQESKSTHCWLNAWQQRQVGPRLSGGKSYEGEHFLDLLSDVPRMNSKTRSKKLLQKFLTRLHMKGTLQRGAFILHAPIDMGI